MNMLVIFLLLGTLSSHDGNVWVNKRNIIGKEGESVTLHCDYNDRYTDVLWFKKPREGNLKLIARTNEHGMVNETHYKIVNRASLQISALEYPRDDGQFECTAGNSVIVMVTVTVPPMGISIKDNTFSVDDRTHRITCLSLKANPPPTFKWLIDGRELQSNVVHPNSSVSQVILAPTRELNGKTLEWEASNVAGNTQSSTPLNITYKPVINISDPNFPIEEGATLEITCTVDSNPEAIISWKSLATGKKTNSAKYIRSPVSRHHAGIYNCDAHNSEGNDSKSISVKISYPPSVTVVFEDDMGELKCTADGNPAVYTFSAWQYTVGNATFPRVNGTKSNATSSFNISQLLYGRLGAYMCNVSNEVQGYQTTVYQMRTSPLFLEGMIFKIEESETRYIISVPFYTYPVFSSVHWNMPSLERFEKNHQEHPAPFYLHMKSQSIALPGNVTTISMPLAAMNCSRNYTVTVVVVYHNGSANASFVVSCQTKGFQLQQMVLPVLALVALLTCLVCGCVFRRYLSSFCTRRNEPEEELNDNVLDQILAPQIMEGHYADLTFENGFADRTFIRGSPSNEYASIDFRATAKLREYNNRRSRVQQHVCS